MHLKIRRILYIFFIIIFLVISPLVCLYAAGYKIKSGFTIQKTGMLILNTEPKNAKIYLDGKIQKLFLKKFYSEEKSFLTTPTKIKNLLPGEYNVKLKLKNYWPWQKKLKIYPGQTTFAEDIILFKNDLPLILNNVNLDNILLSSNKKYWLWLNKNYLIVKKLENEEEKKLLIATSTATALLSAATTGLWSPDNQKVIINGWLFNMDNPNSPISLNRILGEQAKNFRWNINDNNKIYYSAKNTVNYYDLSTASQKIIFKDQPFIDFLPKNDYLYLVKQSDLSTELDVWNYYNNNLLARINLPNSPYTFLHPKHKLINLYDQKHQLLYLIDPLASFKPLRETISNINKTYWINDYQLLYANDFEIWILNLKNLNKTLLTRISNKINEIIWHPSNHYVIYSTDNSINIIELDQREKYNITKLIKLEAIKNLYLNKDGDVLYFYAKIGNQKGLYKLAI